MRSQLRPRHSHRHPALINSQLQPRAQPTPSPQGAECALRTSARARSARKRALYQHTNIKISCKKFQEIVRNSTGVCSNLLQNDSTKCSNLQQITQFRLQQIAATCSKQHNAVSYNLQENSLQNANCVSCKLLQIAATIIVMFAAICCKFLQFVGNTSAVSYNL